MYRATVIAVCLLALAASGHAGVTFSLAGLGQAPGATRTCGEDLNNKGEVVGGATMLDGTACAFVWSENEGARYLSALGGTNSCARGLNELGQIVGSRDDVAFLWDDGIVRDLGTLPGGSSSAAYAIDSQGNVVGSSGPPYRAFLWDGTMHELDILPGELSAHAYALNDFGSVVGWCGDGMDVLWATMWTGGTAHNLGVLPGTRESVAYAVSDTGLVVGVAAYSFEGHQPPELAFLWDGTMHELGPLPGGSRSRGFDVNSHGWVVGESTSDLGWRAVLWDDGAIMDLNDCVDASGDGWLLFGARAVNEHGQILGYGNNPSGAQESFLLTPIPEPAGLLTLVCGLVGLGGMAWRRRR